MSGAIAAFTSASCVRANNLDVARSMLLDLEQQLLSTENKGSRSKRSNSDEDEDDDRELFTYDCWLYPCDARGFLF